METKAERNTPLHALCLEDTPQDAEIMRELLTNEGFVLDMDCTDKEKEFVSFLRTGTYDIILSDFKLPGFDGFAALHWAMEICPKVPFICVSGTIGEEKAIELLKQGAVDYVIKDRLARLPAAIKRALNEAEEKELRRQAEKKLRNEQLMHSRTEEIAHIGSWEWDIATDTVIWSDELFRIFQRDPLEGAPSFAEHPAFYPPDDMACLRQAVEAAVSNGTPYELELRAIRKDGEIRMCVARGIAEMKPDGRVVRLFGSFQDITERKQAEEALRESETNFRSLFENSLMGISSATPDGRLIKANMAYARMYGYENPNEMMAEVANVGKLYVNPGDRKEVLQILAEKGVMEPREVEVVRRDGTHFFVLVSARAMRDANGKILYSQANHIDITERKRAGEALRESELMLRTVADFTYDWEYWLDGNRNIPFISPSCERVTGYSQKEFIEDPVLLENIVHPDDVDYVKRHLERVLSSEQRHIFDELEFRIIHKDGSVIHIHHVCRPIFDETNKYHGRRVSNRNITERKQAEVALKENNIFLQTLLDAIPAPVFYKDNEGHYTGVNKSFLIFTGKTSQEIIGKTVFEISPREFAEIYHAKDLELLQCPGIQIYDAHMMDGQGILHDVVYHKATFTDSDDHVVGLIGVILDITDRKQVEETLARERTLLRTLIDALPDRIFVKDINGKFILNNIAHLKALGVNSQEEAFGKTDYDFRPKEFADRFALSDNKIVQTGKPVISSEEQSISDSGEVGWMLSNKVPLRDAQGTIIGLVGNSHDITERKKIEEDVRKLSSAVEQSGSLIVITDIKGNIEYVNPKFIELTGYSMQEVIGKNPRILKSGKTQSEEYKNLWSTIKNGRVWRGEFQNKKKNGDFYWESASISPVRDASGIITHFISVNEDITQQKAISDQLRQMQKLEGLGTLAGGIAHDFNNILGIILAYITNVHRSKDDTKKLDLAVDTIVKAVERGKTLVQQILTFARKKETTFGAVNVNEVVMEIITMIFETFPKILTYGQNFDKSISYINADRSQLHQALLNLCVNARDAMPSGGVLTMSTRVVSGVDLQNQYADAFASSYVCIEVNDTGEGMTPETKERIFEPFFTTKAQGKGTGLGLAVVFGIVQSHKGFIDVESVVGKGTTFRLYLPASQAAKPVSVKEEETLEKISGGSETLLVVEDEEMLLMSLKMVLVEKGYKVISIGDGLEAVNIYKERKKEIALVLTDLGLPKMNGMEVCTQVKKLNPKVRMIVATGFLDPGMKSKLLKAGILHFLYKPYNLLEVLKVVREVLDEK